MAGVATYTGAFGAEQAERLLWRAGFGPRPGEAAALAAKGLDDAVTHHQDTVSRGEQTAFMRHHDHGPIGCFEPGDRFSEREGLLRGSHRVLLPAGWRISPAVYPAVGSGSLGPA